jgi:exosortase
MKPVRVAEEEVRVTMSVDLAPTNVSRHLKEAPAGLWAAVAVGAALLASYLPSVRALVELWWAEPNYSHGFLVAPIAALILWQRRDQLARVEPRPSAAGWLAVLAILALRAYLYERNEMWMEQATIPAMVGALVLAFGGWRMLAWALPGVAFLAFLLPLPPRINVIMAGPLQAMATIASTALLQATGLPVLSEGNVIYVGTVPLEVARACNGLSMLLSFVTLITATTILVRTRPLWERVVLMASTVPIALVANILRIAATAWAYHAFGPKFGDKIAHDTAGWLMMPIALVLVWIELKAFAWLVVEDDTSDRAMVFLPTAPPPRPIKK